MTHIPCFYHPTTLALIDDDLDFLNSLTLALAPQYHCMQFQSPQTAQKFLIEQHTLYQDARSYLTLEYRDHPQVRVQLASIVEQVFQKHRFEQVVVCVIDYDMPGMNGLDFARQLKSTLPIKIILLTGETDQTTAIEAFNQHIIDGFVLKSDANYLQQLAKLVSKLQYDYFIASTTTIIEPFITHLGHPLYDVDFIQLFQRICQENSIVEWYLADESGSFLLLDNAGKTFWLLIRTEADMETFAELADHDGLAELAKKLMTHEVIACYPTPIEITAPAQTWKISPATQIKHKPIYYALVDQYQGYTLENKKIDGYRDFLLSG